MGNHDLLLPNGDSLAKKMTDGPSDEPPGSSKGELWPLIGDKTGDFYGKMWVNDGE